jgi:hypothetical protein
MLCKEVKNDFFNSMLNNTFLIVKSNSTFNINYNYLDSNNLS